MFLNRVGYTDFNGRLILYDLYARVWKQSKFFSTHSNHSEKHSKPQSREPTFEMKYLLWKLIVSQLVNKFSIILYTAIIFSKDIF